MVVYCMWGDVTGVYGGVLYVGMMSQELYGVFYVG